MSTILSALKSSQQVRNHGQLTAITLCARNVEKSPRRWWLWYLVVAPLCWALGAALYLSWQGWSVDRPKPLSLPYQEIAPFKFVTRALPIVPAQPQRVAAPVQKQAPASVAKTPTKKADESDPLAKRVMLALQEVEKQSQQGRSKPVVAPIVSANGTAISDLAQPLKELPTALQQQVPALAYSSHVYSSAEASRTVVLNGKTYHQGNWVTSKLQLVEIRQDGIILRIQGQSFSLKELMDWPGA